MKALLLTTTLLLFYANLCLGQNHYAAAGAVTDTSSREKLEHASIKVLQLKDSILVTFTRADVKGQFSLTNLPGGKFFLLVSYPGYADYVEPFTLDSGKTKLDFGNINLTLKAKLLQDVIIKGKAAAIKIKGDTTEFNAASYTIQPNSKVEDLLKQLPGIQIDKDGKITAQGKPVSKVLVDGEEFFGDDPTLVTKNIRGDMVDKVQLYDRKSDQAAFTGMDDGKESKTINIKLKDDKKSGYFGKADFGVATSKYYQGQGMINIFKEKQKIAVYGTLGNTGKVGLGWEDSSKYGTSDNVEFGDGVIMINNDASDPLESYNGRYDGQGIPLTRSGGVHYDTKWNNDKESLNTNYKAGSMDVEGVRAMSSQNNLPSNIIKNNSDETFDNFIFRQKLDATYLVKIDSTSTLKLSGNGTIKRSEVNSKYKTIGTRNDSLLNQSSRDLENKVNDKIFFASALWTKKFKAKGRTLSVNLSMGNNHSEARGFLKSQSDYFGASGQRDSSQLIDQYKTSTNNSSNLKGNIVYTEPLSHLLTLVLNYGLNSSSDHSDRKSFNPSSPEHYDLQDTLYSNNYRFNQLTNETGAILNFKKNKTTFNFGTKVSAVRFNQKNNYDNSTLNRSFLNWSPELSYSYRFSQQKGFAFNYNGSNILPSIDQIQPVVVNTDPLNITIGNPDLKPAFKNTFALSYNSFKTLSEQYFYISVYYNVIAHPIVNTVTTDAAGKSIYQSINLDGKATNDLYLYAFGQRKIKPLGLSAGFSLGTNGNTYYSYINNVLNKTKSYSYNLNLNFSKSKEKKYDSHLQFGPTYSTSKSSLQLQNSSNGWGFKSDAGFTVYLPFKMEISTDGSYEYLEKTQSFNTNFSRLLWNAQVSRKFLKSEGLKLSVSANDLLNQNAGFNRSATGTSFTQTNYNTIRRYFMASLSWDFSKMGTGKKSEK